MEFDAANARANAFRSALRVTIRAAYLFPAELALVVAEYLLYDDDIARMRSTTPRAL